MVTPSCLGRGSQRTKAFLFARLGNQNRRQISERRGPWYLDNLRRHLKGKRKDGKGTTSLNFPGKTFVNYQMKIYRVCDPGENRLELLMR